MPTARIQTEPTTQFWRNVLVTIALVAVTIACYWSVRNHEFINYDDDVYITDNAMVRPGLTAKGVAWAFGTFAVANWHPVTWLSHMIDCSLFGGTPDNAGAHHFVNVVIHATNAALLVWLLTTMTGTFWRSSLVAALFALHPLHVESVAWVAERKDVLSTMFGLLTLFAYVRWVRLGMTPHSTRTRRTAMYALMMILFALGLMAKPMLVTLPCVMLLLDAWPLGRVRFADTSSIHPPAEPGANGVVRLIVEKIPLFTMSIASSVVTMMAQSRSGAVWSTESLSVPARLANAAVAYGQYLRQTFWPSGLSLIYPLPKELPAWQFATTMIALIGVTMLCAMMWKRRPYLIVGWLWFLGMLVPVIGLVQVGPQARADRYSYVPLIGVFIMLAWSLPAVARTAGLPRRTEGKRKKGRTADVTDFTDRERGSKWRALGGQVSASSVTSVVSPAVANAIAVACVGMLIAMSVVTWTYLQKWRDSVTLFTHVLAETDDNSIAHGNMAAALANLNPPDLEGAIEHNEKALVIWPENAKASKNLGNALVAAGQPGQAIEFLNKALAIKPNYVEARSDLGAAYARMGQPAMAIEQYQLALAIDPDFTEARSNLGGALVAMQRSAEALPHLERIVAQQPDYAKGHFNFACALGELGRTEQSIQEFRTSIALNPKLLDARFNLGLMLFRAGRVDEAISQFEDLLKLNPGHAMAHNNLARALASVGRSAEAIKHCRDVIVLVPDNASAINNLAAMLLDATDATVRKPAEALSLAQRAVELTNGSDAGALNTLSRARAANGDLAGAIDAAQAALTLAQGAGNTALVEELQRRITGYRSGNASP